MFSGKKILGIIPARGGSKGVSRKNIRLLDGVPLVGWTINEAKKANSIDRLILSSEDDEIISVARTYGCEVPFKRPMHLAEDSTPGIDPILHALSALKEEYDYVVQLQPTSPLRRSVDIENCVKLCVESDAPSCVSIVEVTENPLWMFSLAQDKRLQKYSNAAIPARRQELPVLFILNGAVYIAKADWLKEQKSFIGDGTVGYVMEKRYSLDIDTEDDFYACESQLKRNKTLN